MLAQGRGWCAVSKKPKLIQIIRKGDALVRINPAFSSLTLEVYLENGKDLFGTLKQISVQPTTELTRCASRNGGNSQVPKDLLGTLKQILGKLTEPNFRGAQAEAAPCCKTDIVYCKDLLHCCKKKKKACSLIINILMKQLNRGYQLRLIKFLPKIFLFIYFRRLT